MAKPWAEAFYHSGQWRATRKLVLRRDHYTCCDCEGRATEVHHIIELTPSNINDPHIALNPDNLMSLCGDCHKKRTLNIGDVQPGLVFDDRGQLIPLPGRYIPPIS